MFDLKEFRKPSFIESVSLLAIVFIILGAPIIFMKGLQPHIPIIWAIVFLLIYGLFKRVKFDSMQSDMIQAVSTSMAAVYLFFFIGILISVLMIAGTIPTLIYYGLNVMSVKTFYLSSFLLTAIIGVSIGSSLTTTATLGVALLGLAHVFHLNPAITAGAIVSGAFFGDKMSPLSDTTGIAASIVGIDLFEHIKNMMYTTIPAFIISSIFFTVLSPWKAATAHASLSSFREEILSTGLVSPISLLPFVLLIVFSILKFPAVVSIIVVSIVGCSIAIFEHNVELSNLAFILFDGFHAKNAPSDLAHLLNRGGINSMFFTITIVILALSLGGLLFSLGIIPTILNKMSNFLNSQFRATVCVILTAVGVNVIIGEQYLSILLAGKTFKPVYDKLNLPSRNLSRTLEDAGTVINPLVPWSVCGVFITNALGVTPIEYAPFSIFCYSSLILTFLSGVFSLFKEKH